MWPKDSAGQWIEPLDPKFGGGMGSRDYSMRTTAILLHWDVPQDYSGLIQLMGGTAKATANLDSFSASRSIVRSMSFKAKFPDSTSMVGQFSMGNEPSLAIPYIYNRLGAPWKTQKRVRMLLKSFFTDTLLGVPGDEEQRQHDGAFLTSRCRFLLFARYGAPYSAGHDKGDAGFANEF